MLLSSLPLVRMGASYPEESISRLFQWRSTAAAILDLGNQEEDEVKKSPPEPSGGPGFIIGTDAAARVAHLEHSVRFLQEQHRLMLSGLHTEIEALRERNRDLQFQLIFNKEATPAPTKQTLPTTEEPVENKEESKLKREVSRLEKEAAAARGEARAAEARALQLQRVLDVQTEKLRELEVNQCAACSAREEEAESRAELRLRLADAERLVRRLRADAERQRRELQAMKSSLHASLRGGGLDPGFGFQNSYHFPPVHTPDFWREPLREEYPGPRGRNRRLPELHRSTVYANNHTRPRANGFENKSLKKSQSCNGEQVTGKSPEEQSPTPGSSQDGARRRRARRPAPDHT